MSLDAIVDKIRQDAAAEARRQLEAAERERQEALAAARASMEEEYARDLKRLDSAMAELKSRLEYHVKREQEREVENARRTIVNAAIESAVENLCRLPDTEYLELVSSLLAGCGFKGDVEVRISPADEHRITSGFLELRSGSGRRFLLSDRRHGGRGGVVLVQGAISLNATFSTAADLSHEALAMQIAGTLAGGKA
jgi:V/A-type H+/Na+-transporting ATPase subunit E